MGGGNGVPASGRSESSSYRRLVHLHGHLIVVTSIPVLSLESSPFSPIHPFINTHHLEKSLFGE